MVRGEDGNLLGEIFIIYIFYNVRYVINNHMLNQTYIPIVYLVSYLFFYLFISLNTDIRNILQKSSDNQDITRIL